MTTTDNQNTAKGRGKKTTATTNAAKMLDQLFQSGTLETTTDSGPGDAEAEQGLDARVQGFPVPGSEPRMERSEIVHIPLELLFDNPYQPRETIEKDQDYWDFVENVKQYGIKGAIPARKFPGRNDGSHQLAWGHRRREVARDAGLKTLPITVEDLDNAAMAALAAIENVHRSDLTEFELGKLFKNMNEEGWTQEQIASRVKKDRGFVVNRLRLVTSEDDIQEHVRRKPNSLRAVAYLVKIKDPADRALLYPRLEDGRLTTDDLANDVEGLLQLIKAEEANQRSNGQQSESTSGENGHRPSPVNGKATAAPTATDLDSHPQARETEKGEREQTRVFSAKLRRISSNLQAVARENREREDFSPTDRKYLKEIGTTYKQLCERAQVDIRSILEV